MSRYFLAVCLLFVTGQNVAFSQTGEATIQDLLDHPETFSQDQSIEIKCYFARESSVWLHLLEKKNDCVGFFGYDIKNSFIISEDIIFPYFFVSRSLSRKIHTLRKGDPLILTGKCFKHRAVGKDQIGVMVNRLQILGEDAPVELEDTSDGEKKNAWPGGFSSADEKADSLSNGIKNETYTMDMGGSKISGLRFGEKYVVNGVEFVVSKDETKRGGE